MTVTVTTDGRPIALMGHIQTNADRNYIGIIDLGGHIYHYTSECSPLVADAIESLRKTRTARGGSVVTTYETNEKAGDVRRHLNSLGYHVVTRQDLAYYFKTITCRTCGEGIN